MNAVYNWSSRWLFSTKKICLQNYKRDFHSTSPVQMFGRFSSPVRRYGLTFGAGMAAASVYAKTTSYGSTTATGQYSVKEGVSGSITLEPQSFSSDTKMDLISCTSTINDSSVILNPNTELLIQISLVFGLIVEVFIIGVLISFSYKYGFKEGYLIIKKKFEEVKKPVLLSLEHFCLFFIFLWVWAIDNAQTNLINLSFAQTDGIKELYKAVSDLQNFV